jgi:hypothetical protein
MSFGAILFAVLTTLLVTTKPIMGSEKGIVGTWRLVSMTYVDGSTGKEIDLWGAGPIGFLTYTPGGRMSAVLAAAGRKTSAKSADQAPPEEQAIVEWADIGGHWLIVVRFDTRGNDDPWDDVLIFADSFDRYDDYQDGYSFVNANRFYWLWYDAFCFDKLTWRTMITAAPRERLPEKSVIP